MALVYVKRHIKARHQMQLQSSEDGLVIVSPTKEQKIAQSGPPIKKSPVCDSFKSKTTSKSSVTKLPAVTPIAQKQSKAKRKKAKKAKSLPIRSELTTEAVTKANSSRVDDGKLQANIIRGKSVTSTNTLTCEAKPDATLVALMDQKENPDEDLSWRSDVLPPCMVNTASPFKKKLWQRERKMNQYAHL